MHYIKKLDVFTVTKLSLKYKFKAQFQLHLLNTLNKLHSTTLYLKSYVNLMRLYRL